MSYGFEFDAAGLSEVDKIEQNFLHDTTPLSPVACPAAPFGNVTQEHETPRAAAQTTLTPRIGDGKGNGSAFSMFSHGRERISTPVEDSEHVGLFSSTHSPVFSPVARNSASDAFDSDGNQLQTARKNSENQASNNSKR